MDLKALFKWSYLLNYKTNFVWLVGFIGITTTDQRTQHMWGNQAEWVACQNIDFEKYPIIVWNSFCIILFSATQNCLYLLNHKSDFDEVFSKTKLSECCHKYTSKLKFDSAWHKTYFTWSHQIWCTQRQTWFAW